jgi:hypothetical protein
MDFGSLPQQQQQNNQRYSDRTPGTLLLFCGFLRLTDALGLPPEIPSSSWIVIVRHDVVLLLAFDSRSNVLECGF